MAGMNTMSTAKMIALLALSSLSLSSALSYNYITAVSTMSIATLASTTAAFSFPANPVATAGVSSASRVSGNARPQQQRQQQQQQELQQRPLLSLQLAATATTAETAQASLPSVPLKSISNTQTAFYDGSEWESIQHLLHQQSKLADQSPTECGQLQLVAGTIWNETTNQEESVVGILASAAADQHIYVDSIVMPAGRNANKEPSKQLIEDCMATYTLALSTVHCVMPQLDDIGGSSSAASFPIAGSKIVVAGGSAVAQFAANGLSAMGMDVFLVTTDSEDKIQKNLRENVKVMQPAQEKEDSDIDEDDDEDDDDEDFLDDDDDDIGFCEAIGNFDAFLDTANDERGPLNPRSPQPFKHLSSTVTTLLKERHNCHVYVSTRTKSQELLADNGVFWGPGKAKDYVKTITNKQKSSRATNVLPPNGIGATIQTLIDNNVVITAKQKYKECHANANNDLVRGFAWSDFWEDTTWPRDTSGSGTTRYGLPVRLSEIDLADETALVEAKTQSSNPGARPEFVFSDAPASSLSASGATESQTVSLPKTSSSSASDNPYVLQISNGMDGIEADIVQQDRTCAIFMSARFCKKCKQMSPQYTRMARTNTNDDLMFAKAEASGPAGKLMGRQLSVEAVPAFVFYRHGQRYGTPMMISKLPSTQLDRALELLSSGKEWDHEYIFTE